MFLSTSMPKLAIKLELFVFNKLTFSLSFTVSCDVILTFCCMSLSVWSHWSTCGGRSKLSVPFFMEHLVEARGLPAGWKFNKGWKEKHQNIMDGWTLTD